MTGSKPNEEILKINQIEADTTQEVYTNGFQIAFGNADVIVTFQRNGRPVQIMNMSFTLAKTLSQLLGNVIDQIETKGDFKIKTTKELDETIGAEDNK